MTSQILILSILFNAGGLDVKERSVDVPSAEFITAPIPKNDNSASKLALSEAIQLVKDNEPNPWDTYERCILWAEIAKLSIKLGDWDGAKQATATSEETARELKEDIGYQGVASREIAKEWARHGDVAKVFEITTRLPKNICAHEVILKESAEAAAEFGQYEAALKIVKEFPKKEDRERHFKEIKRLDILYRAKQGITDALIKEVDQLVDENQKVELYVGHAELYPSYAGLELREPSFFNTEFTAGNRRQAIAFVQKAEVALKKIDDENHKRTCIFMISRAYALFKEPQSIRKIIPLIPPAPEKKDPKYYDHELCHIQIKAMLAAAETAAGNLVAANQVVKDAVDAEDKVYYMMYIGLTLHKQGKTEQAKTTFRKAHELLDRLGKNSILYHNFASAEATCGDFKAAVETASGSPAGSAFSNIANIMSKAGLNQDARWLTVKRVTSIYMQGTVLMLIAERQAKAGQVQEVKKWIAEDDNQVRKAYATVGLAKGLFNEKSPVK